jgi:hypothetical protein
VAGNDLIPYYETLLFILAYPDDEQLVAQAESELVRLTKLLKTNRKHKTSLYENSGMPFTEIVTRFSHDKVRWLFAHPDCDVSLHSFEDPAHHLNDVLKLTLPSLEKSETTAALSNMELMDVLKVPVRNRLLFLIRELDRFDHLPYLKDHLFDRLDVFVRVTPRDKIFSKAYNRLPGFKPHYHTDLLKRFEPRTILDSPLPSPALLDESLKNEMIRVVKNSLVITARETDPTTYMDENSFRLFHLERGISIAIYGMIPSRQLPLESYVGFTAFKNGFPASYGGAWVFGERSNFGINIFETFRNGESGFIMAQLLRVYRYVFNINYFEVEPYQFGLDNPEGIESGAFWFYYRFGFRPLDTQLLKLAKKEQEKITTRKGYRTNHSTLVKFTESSIGLKLGKNIPPKMTSIILRVTQMIQRDYEGDRKKAEDSCREKFLKKAGLKLFLNEDENQVLTEVALWAEAMKIRDVKRLALMEKMIITKPVDVDEYQKVLIRFFTTSSSLRK